jgi:hypothetical protein
MPPEQEVVTPSLILFHPAVHHDGWYPKRRRRTHHGGNREAGLVHSRAGPDAPAGRIVKEDSAPERYLHQSLATLALTVVLAPACAVPTAAASNRGVLHPLQLQTGDPLTFCLTDASATALREAGFELDAIAPATLVTEGGHQCMRAVLASGQINTDLTGLTGSDR